MSSVAISGNASGAGVLTIAAPNTASNYTLTLPTNTGTLISTKSAGTILQVVSTTKTDSFSTTSATMIDVTGLSVSITPTSSTSKILIILSLNLAGQNLNAGAGYQMVRGSTAICIGDLAGTRPQTSGALGYIADANSSTTISGNFLDSPATTSSTTYKIQVVGQGASSGAYVNRTQNDTNASNFYNARTASTITVMEIAA